MQRRNIIDSRRQARSGLGPVGAAAPPEVDPIDALAAAIGADLVGLWEPSRGTTVVSGRVDSIVPVYGSGTLQAVASGNRPLYVDGLGGPGGKAFLRIDATGRYLDATISHAAGNRISLCIVHKVDSLVSTYVSMQLINGADDNLFFNGTTNFIVKGAFTTAGEVTVTVTSPAVDTTTWHLTALHPYASGAVLEMDGTATSPNFATSQTKLAMTTLRVGHTSSSGGGSVAGIYFIANASTTYTAALETYVAARFGGDVGSLQASLILAGQSNAADITTWPDACPQVPGYRGVKVAQGSTGFASGHWVKGGGAPGNGTMYNQLRDAIIAAAPGKRPVVALLLGEADSAASEAAALDFGNQLTNLSTEIASDTGRSDIYWIISTLHQIVVDDPSRWAAEVNAGMATWIASLGANGALFDTDAILTSTPLSGDSLHYDADDRVAYLAHLSAHVIAADLL